MTANDQSPKSLHLQGEIGGFYERLRTPMNARFESYPGSHCAHRFLCGQVRNRWISNVIPPWRLNTSEIEVIQLRTGIEAGRFNRRTKLIAAPQPRWRRSAACRLGEPNASVEVEFT
jgi:hypothetical protein